MKKIIALFVLVLTVSSVMLSSTATVSAKQIHVNSEKKVKEVLKKYARHVKVKSVKGSILDMDGDTVQITIKVKNTMSDKLTVKSAYLNVCKVYKAVKKADFKNFKNIGVDAQCDKKTIVKTDTTPKILKEISKHDLTYKYNDLPKLK